MRHVCLYADSVVDFRRHPWIQHAIWGWRREIVAGIVTLTLLLVARSFFAIAPAILLIVAIFVLVTRVDVRDSVRRVMRRANRERRLDAIFWWADLVGRDGKLPILRGAADIPAGHRYLLQLPIGLYLEAVEKRLGELTAAFNARVVRVRTFRGGARYVELIVIEHDPFGEEVPSTLRHLAMRPFNLWDDIELGIGEDGGRVTVDLPEHNLLIGGEPGAGKSVAISTLVAAAALDPTCSLSLFDGKEVEFNVWREVAARFVGTSMKDALAALEELHAVLAQRYRYLVEAGARKVSFASGRGLEVVVIDELAYYLRGGEKADRDRFAELLRDLVARGRAAGIVVIAATQKPSHEIVPTWIRDLFSYRLALRCTSPEASDTILGQGWASQQFNAATIDPAQRGVGYLLAEGGFPVVLRCANLTDEDVAALAHRAREVRGC